MEDDEMSLEFRESFHLIQERLQFKKINECFEETDTSLSLILKLVSSGKKSYSVFLKEDFIQMLGGILEVWLSSGENSVLIPCVTNCYRLCRTACALYEKAAALIRSSGTFLNLTKALLEKLLTDAHRSEEIYVLLRCCVQFLGNFVSADQENQGLVSSNFCSVFHSLLHETDQKLQDYTLLVIYLCWRSAKPCDQSPDIWNLLATALSCAVKLESENGLLVVENALRFPGFCEAVYPRLDQSECTLVLEVCINCLKRIPEGITDLDTSDMVVPAEQNLHFLAAYFIKESQHILNMDRLPATEDKAMCRVKELECLCLATSHHQLYGSLQDVKQLVTTAVELLINIQMLGRESGSVFSNIQKMSAADQVDRHHPVFGLKRDLIRLLGNLAYNHTINQNLIREMDGISAILEQTNIDGKNPFITQWSVFALHNLTEENADNREYVANMRLEGVANNSAVLDEMGLQADVEQGKVVIKKKRSK